jgi:CheY-like chemotaxis protein
LETLQRERPAVFLTDISMDEHDGFWLIGQVRALSPADGGRTRAAALRALTSAEDRARIFQAGFQHHIAKPLEPETLIAMSRCRGHGK